MVRLLGFGVESLGSRVKASGFMDPDSRLEGFGLQGLGVYGIAFRV